MQDFSHFLHFIFYNCRNRLPIISLIALFFDIIRFSDQYFLQIITGHDVRIHCLLLLYLRFRAAKISEMIKATIVYPPSQRHRNPKKVHFVPMAAAVCNIQQLIEITFSSVRFLPIFSCLFPLFCNFPFSKLCR
jgi:hypothetical protein